MSFQSSRAIITACQGLSRLLDKSTLRLRKRLPHAVIALFVFQLLTRGYWYHVARDENLPVLNLRITQLGNAVLLGRRDQVVKLTRVRIVHEEPVQKPQPPTVN